MRQFDLGYGDGLVPFSFDENRFDVVGKRENEYPLNDHEIGAKLDRPIDSLTIEEIVSPGQTVLLVVPDGTREVAAGQIVNLLVRRLIATGVPAHDIRIIFATGIHRRVTQEEKDRILTPFIAQRIKTLDHDAKDLAQVIKLGETSNGIPVELNRALVDHDHVFVIGGINFHYFAGFTGGRKLICPGLASARTILQTHKLAFDCNLFDRRQGVETGRLDGNAVHEAFTAAVRYICPSFSVSTIVSDAGEVTDLFCGNWITAHRAACDAYSFRNTVKIVEKRDIVIASCGGSPHDINLIQAHKSLEAASQACNDAGMIILIAECREGLGRKDFLKWFDAGSSKKLAERLCEKYQVNGQTAWSLLRKTERFDVRLISTLSPETTEKMKITSTQSLSRALAKIKNNAAGYLMPFGAKILVKTD